MYESEALFLRGLHARALPQCPIPPRCLSALAGAGKSALILAVERVMPVEEMIALPLAIAHAFPMRSCQRIVVDAASTMRELLDPMLPSDLRVQQIRVSEACRRPRIEAAQRLVISTWQRPVVASRWASAA